jgi:FeS assembly SUF system protein
MKVNAVADEEMIKNALGDEHDELAEPPHVEAPKAHELWPVINAAIKEIYDPEIPVNIYELGLIYKVDINPREDGKFNAYVEMTLTSPACPVAQDMPSWVQGALFAIEEIEDVEVDIVWDPPWEPSMMAETAKLQLNMFT